MSFSREAWERIAPLYGAILELPFNRELAAGTLSRERFTFYMLQDAHYLTWFGRALMDLRHYRTPGRSEDFPVGEPTRVRFRSHPFAARLREGERIVVAIGGGSSELEPDPRHPAITLSGGSIDLPVTTGGRLRFR